ncbi:MAG: enoyl-CoA hydratase/isomerase family protein, partial [Methylobacterium sp.]|nr:enoyl-CoA hydratase/isomerase family protein [Methylobacterium sp.]
MKPESPRLETLRLTWVDTGIATLTLSAPEKHNALSPAMIAELTGIAARINADPAIRVVILAGEGASFCAGGDLGWMRQQMTATRGQRMAEARKLAEMLYALNTLEKPLIGRVHGNAFGGGVGMIAVCDVAIAAEGAKLGLTETKLGLIPATISPYVLARMGEGRARRVFMSARLFEAREAAELGLIAKVVPAEDLDATVMAEAKPYLATAPGAVAASKALARAMGPRI